jgi:signal transduction histidine kinase
VIRQGARTRLALATSLSALLVTALVLGGFYVATWRVVEAETRQVVNAELAGLADDYRRLGTLGLARAIERRMADANARDAIYLLTDAQGRKIAGNLRDWPPTVVPGSGWVTLELYRTDADRPVTLSAASVRLRGGERLLVGRDSAGRALYDRALWQAGALALIAAAALSLATGWLLSRVVFSRLSEIARTADRIVTGDLDQRVPIRGTGDELDRLSETLNAMLDRIGQLVAHLRTTTDSLAHDLRSPLTRLRGQVEQMADPDLAPLAREALAARALSEADHLLRVFSALTQIARAETGVGREDFAPLDLGALARELAELYAPAAADRGVTLEVAGAAAPVTGNRTLIAQAVSNLVENALRYTPEGGTLTLALSQTDAHTVLAVTDTGPGIPEDQREAVLARFVTLDPARSARGAGLGLALAQAVAHLHGGDLVLSDNAPGLRAALRLPCGTAPA